MGIKFIGDPTPEELERLKLECQDMCISLDSVEFVQSFSVSEGFLNVMTFILQIRLISYCLEKFYG